MSVNPIPEGYTTVTPYLVVADAAKAIEFYQKAFGAEEVFRMCMPGTDTIMHCEIKIGGSHIMMSQEWPEQYAKAPTTVGGTTAIVHLYVKDVDAAFKKAVDAGCEVAMPPMDAFWGDRFGKVKDPHGHEWSLATHIEDVPPEEMDKRAAEWFANMGDKC